MVFTSPWEIMEHKVLPQTIMQKVQDSLKKANDEPDYQEVLKKYDMASIYLNSEDCEKTVRKEAEHLKKIVTQLGMYKKQNGS